MTTKLQGQPSVIFRQNFGFKPGLRNTLYSAVQGIQCDQYNSLPCQPVQTMDTSDNDNLANNFDSLKCEGENGYRGNCFLHHHLLLKLLRIMTLNSWCSRSSEELWYEDHLHQKCSYCQWQRHQQQWVSKIQTFFLVSSSSLLGRAEGDSGYWPS